MKTPTTLFFAATAALLTLSSSGTARAEYDIKDYRAESHLNVFAMYLSPNSGELEKAWGGGLGFDFFFNEFIGVSLGGAWADVDAGDMWQTYTADFNLRFPIPEGGLAPYVYVGGGAFIGDGSEMLARGGAGLDIRFLPIPLFIDWSYTFLSGTDGSKDGNQDFQALRIGTRLVF